MTDQELRALVRDAIARHSGGAPAAAPAPPVARQRPTDAGRPQVSAPHASHALYLTLVAGGDACLIEPAVECTHCGYCQSHGH